MTQKSGRPPVEKPRTKITPVRLNEDEAQLLATAAKIADMPMGRMIREDALAAAKRRITKAYKQR